MFPGNFSANSINTAPGLTTMSQFGKSTPCTSSMQPGSPLGGVSNFCKAIIWLLNCSTVRLLLGNWIPVAQAYLPVMLEMKAQAAEEAEAHFGLESCNWHFKVPPFLSVTCSLNDPNWQIDKIFLTATSHCPGTKIISQILLL